MRDEEQRRYIELRRTRPDLFENRAPDSYPVAAGGAVRFENAHLMVLDDQVETSSGETASYLRILSPPSGAPGAAVLPLSDGKVILLDNPRHALGRRLLEIPRGFGEPGESAEDSAARELYEEIGVAPTHLHPLGPLHPDSGLLTTIVSLFAAEVPSRGWKPENGVELRTFDIPDLERAISDGVIADGFTIACFLRARLRGLI